MEIQTARLKQIPPSNGLVKIFDDASGLLWCGKNSSLIIAACPGIGERKPELYGEELIRIVAQYPCETTADIPGGEVSALAEADARLFSAGGRNRFTGDIRFSVT